MEIKSVKRPPKELIEGFRSVGTSTISDLLDQMGIDGVISGIKAIRTGCTMAGPAITVKEASGLLGSYGIEDFTISEVIDFVQSGDVLVFDNAGKEISTWGGLASTAAKMKAIEGVVIDGACRDLHEIEDLDIPVFSRHITPRGAKRRIKILEINGIIQCGGVRVESGDIIVADSTGIVVIPNEKAEEILEKAINTERGENAFAEELRKGKTFGEMQKKTGLL